MLIPLSQATPTTSGPKAASLATLLSAGLPVPDGVVIPFPPTTPAVGAPTTRAAWVPITRAAWEPTTPAAREPGTPAAREPAIPVAGEPAIRAAWEPTTPAAREPGTPAAREPAIPVAGEPAIRAAWEPATPAAGVPTTPAAGVPAAPGVGAAAACAVGGELTAEEVEELRRWLVSEGDPVVAVRSSAANEDTGVGSAAGQHDSFLGVRGIDAVVDAVRACRASVWSARATAYRKGAPAPAMAVIIQHHVDADVSGVLFTAPDGTTLIESSWGLGPSVVEGHVTPDRYEVRDTTVTRTIADKPTTLTREGSRLLTRPVPTAQRRTPTLTDTTARTLATLAHQAATLFNTPQDVEWALTPNALWLLQSRPITTTPPPPANAGRSVNAGGSASAGMSATAGVPASAGTSAAASTAATASASVIAGAPASPGADTLAGTPASRGVATGPARVVRGPADFASVRPGDILVCPYTDPAWTPLLSVVAGVITETGGILSHAAIVAREHGIPAVVAVPDATTRIPTGAKVTFDGSTGAVRFSASGT
ncbi:PEP/pyruvate-binding domain-containing protein [Kribbella sp. WER1]